MIKELGELNEKFYQLYGRLHNNKSLLAIKPEQIQYMATALFNQYKAEYKLLVMRAEIREKRALYDAELRHDMLVPRKSFFFRNRAMKQLDNDILDELEAWFEARENGESQEDLPLGWEKEQDEQSAASARPAEHDEPGVAPERRKKRNAAAQVPGQLSLLN